jgi:AcrR family transcriptional regulator
VGKKAAPRGADEVRHALIEACERLCATQPPPSVSIRDVAAQANVTSGLVHHYFESKDQLLAATVTSIATNVDDTARAVLDEGGDNAAMLRAVRRVLDERPAFRSIVLWWAVSDRDVTELMGGHPFLRTLVARLGGPGGADALDRAGTIIAMLLAGQLVPGINRALGRQLDDPAVGDLLAEAIVDLAMNQER